MVRTSLRLAPEGGWMDPLAAGELLSSVGITVVPVRTAHRVQQALAAAGRLGYPVALKTADVKVRLAPATAESDPHGRRLR